MIERREKGSVVARLGRCNTATVTTIATMIAAASLSGCVPQERDTPLSIPSPATRPEVETIADGFITTFWCGPPLNFFDDDRAREIAEAGFNLVGASCEGPVNPVLNQRALRIAKRHGLRMLIKDARVSAARPLRKDWQVKANRAIATYRKHDSLAGFFLVDEPRDATLYPDIAALRQRIRTEAPGRIGYVNLLPDYVFPGPEDYREYVESYVFETRPELLSYDHYPFLDGSDRPSFFENLLVFRELSLEYDVPFLLIVQLMPHHDYRDVSDQELAWQVFHALAFGARGISYFAYWTPSRVPDNLAYRFRKGIIEAGLPTEHYHRVAALNPRIRAIGDELSGFRPTSLWDSRSEFGSSTPPAAIGAIESGAVVVGEFARENGPYAALVVNRDYRLRAQVTLEPPQGASLEVFDEQTRTWSSAGTSLDLQPGQGRLIRSR